MGPPGWWVVAQGEPYWKRHSELSTPFGVVAVAVLVYHGLQLRRDQALRSEAPAPPAARAGAPVADVAPIDVPSAASGRRSVCG